MRRTLGTLILRMHNFSIYFMGRKVFDQIKSFEVKKVYLGDIDNIGGQIFIHDVLLIAHRITRVSSMRSYPIAG